MEKRSGHGVISSIFILMLLVGTFFVVTTEMVSADQDGDYTYTVSGGVATITGFTGVGGAITIPSTLGGFSTVYIGDSAFDSYNGHLITSVIIPSSITTIGNFTFHLCTSLTSVTIPNSVTTIGNYAFYSCASLSSVTIPNSVTTIGNGAFDSCASLTSVTIPNSVTTVRKYTFYSCFSLTSVTIPNSVTTIGNSAFEYCSSLISVTIPSSVTTISDYAFSYCVSLTSITFLGLVAPTTVGFKWILGTPASVSGHAYAASDFPAPGDNWHGLTMGTNIIEHNSPVFGTPSPANGSIGNLLNLTWSIPINDPEGDSFNWMIQCSNGQSANANRTSNGTKPLSLSGLAALTMYKIWVNATDPTGSGLYTRKWYTFTTKGSGGGGSTPTTPVIIGPKSGTKNTIYTYTALSTDADNDTLQYTFDWGDPLSIPQSSGFIPNGAGFTVNHSWTTAGRYDVTVTVTGNQTESSSNITVYIDAVQTGDIGYLLDNNGDGIYDTFYSNISKQITTVQKKDGNYLIDSDGNGDWDYTFDATKGLMPYEESPKTPGFEIILIVCAIALILLWKRGDSNKKP